MLNECKINNSLEKIFAYHVTEKNLYLEYMRNSLNSTISKQKYPIRKWAKDFNTHFISIYGVGDSQSPLGDITYTSIRMA